MRSVQRFLEACRRRRGTAVPAVLLTGALVLAGTGSVVGFPFGGQGPAEPDLILVNGVVLTMDEERPRARAIAITGDEITAVGSRREVARLAGPDTRTVNLRRRTVIPGLVDGHTHAIRGGQTFDQETYWLGIGSLEDALADGQRGGGRAGPATSGSRWWARGIRTSSARGGRPRSRT